MQHQQATSAEYISHLQTAVAFLRQQLTHQPTVGLVLGSGLGGLANELGEPQVIPYTEIPFFPRPSVHGHSGNLIVGTLSGRRVACLQGRVHLYEGYSGWDVTFPHRVLALLGVQSFIVTNAAGGMNPEFAPGDVMVIRNQASFFVGLNHPCRGLHDPLFGKQFFDMTDPYDLEVIGELAADYAAIGLRYREGVYVMLPGPSYESRAEIGALQKLGFDAVGVSTVPEVLALRQMGRRVVGFSLITNLAAGISATPLDHQEVLETSERAKLKFQALIQRVVARL